MLREKVLPTPHVVPCLGSPASPESQPARLSGFHSSSIPSNRFKIVMRGGWGVSLRCPLPPPGGGVPSASCLLLMRRRHPEPGAEPPLCSRGAVEGHVPAAFFNTGEPAAPTPAPPAYPRCCLVRCQTCLCARLSVRPWSCWVLSAKLSVHVSLLDLGNYYSFIINAIAGKGCSPFVLIFQNSLPNSCQIPLKILLEYFAY